MSIPGRWSDPVAFREETMSWIMLRVLVVLNHYYEYGK